MFDKTTCKWGLVLLAIAMLISSDVFACGTELGGSVDITTWGVK